MKKLLTVILILVLALLLFPIRQQYKDGGSVVYSAVLYEVYDVHAMYIEDHNYSEIKFVEGYIIKILGVQVFNNTNPHIDSFGDQPSIK